MRICLYHDQNECFWEGFRNLEFINVDTFCMLPSCLSSPPSSAKDFALLLVPSFYKIFFIFYTQDYFESLIYLFSDGSICTIHPVIFRVLFGKFEFRDEMKIYFWAGRCVHKMKYPRSHP